MLRVPSKTSVWEIYNGKIADMRRQGDTLQQIGDRIGVTRERVRQILDKRYNGAIKPLPLPESRVATIIGCSIANLINLRKSGVLSPMHKNRFYYYDMDELEKAMLAVQRPCVHCGSPLPVEDRARKYCDICQKEKQRYSYPFLTEEAKEKHRACTLSWQKRNTERFRKTQRKAVIKHTVKKRKEHYTNTRYLVIYGEEIPKGTVIQATGCEKGKLILEDGLKISVANVRKV